MSLREHVSLREHACVSSRGAQSTELVWILDFKQILLLLLLYADDITLLCPSVCGLNEILKICNKYRLENNIIINSRRTICIKFGSTIIEGESTFLTV